MTEQLNITEIRKILQMLKDKNYTIIRCRDWEEFKDRTDLKICIMRHDLDVSIDWALEVGKLEYEMGVRSSFFVLHTKPYYHEPNFIAKCKHLQNMGHEIGLHYDIISECNSHPNLTPKMVLDRELKFLRDNGIEIYGCAAHGGGTYMKEGIVSYDIFKEFKKPDSKIIFNKVPLFTLSLAEYNLYESYYFLILKKFYYMSDCSGNKSLISCIENVEQLMENEKRPSQMLLHPCNHISNITPSHTYSTKDKNTNHPHP